MKRKKYSLIIINSIIFLLLFSTLSSYGFEIKNITISDEKTVFDFEQISISKDNEKLDIIYPRSTIPVIIEKGDYFNIQFNSITFDNIYIYISTAYEPIVDNFLLGIDDIWMEDTTWFAKVFVPQDIPEELYNLSLVIYKNDKIYSNSRPRAVSVINEYTDDFSFIHITDFHVGDPRGFLESIRETLGYKSIKTCINEINLLHPDFVIISGDLVYGQLYPFEYSKEYKICYDMIQMFDVPTFLAPGNHDGYRKFREDGLEFWEQYFGPLYYSFNFGNYHFQAINSYDWPAYLRICPLFISLNWGGCIQENQLKWIEKDLQDNFDANLTFIFMHHNPLWDTKSDSLLRMGYKNRENLLSLIKNYNVDMVLAGHIHKDTVEIKDETIFLTTTTPESEIRTDDGYWGYRLINIKDGKISSYNYKEPKYCIPSYQIKVNFIEPDNVKIKNKLEIDIQVLLKFILPKNDYTVLNGTIIMQREDTYLCEYYVLADISKQSEEFVILI